MIYGTKCARIVCHACNICAVLPHAEQRVVGSNCCSYLRISLFVDAYGEIFICHVG